MSQNAFTLKVSAAYTRDVIRGVARIDYDSMDTLNASTGDVIEIKGKRRTVVKCIPLYPKDEGKGIIRIDRLGRNNSGIAIGDSITIRKIKAVAAEKIVVAPLEDYPPIDPGHLVDALESVPLVKGDNVMVPYYGGRLTFQIIGVTPNANAVNVTQKTVFDIIDEKKEVEQRSGKKKEKRKKQSAKDKRIETLENVIKEISVILDKFHLREGKSKI